MNDTFQIEFSPTLTEFNKVEREPTTDEAGEVLDVQDIGAGGWEFQFVMPADFDDTQPPVNWTFRLG
jgi:hypothetical protein